MMFPAESHVTPLLATLLQFTGEAALSLSLGFMAVTADPAVQDDRKGGWWLRFRGKGTRRDSFTSSCHWQKKVRMGEGGGGRAVDTYKVTLFGCDPPGCQW